MSAYIYSINVQHRIFEKYRYEPWFQGVGVNKKGELSVFVLNEFKEQADIIPPKIDGIKVSPKILDKVCDKKNYTEYISVCNLPKYKACKSMANEVGFDVVDSENILNTENENYKWYPYDNRSCQNFLGFLNENASNLPQFMKKDCRDAIQCKYHDGNKWLESWSIKTDSPQHIAVWNKKGNDPYKDLVENKKSVTMVDVYKHQKEGRLQYFDFKNEFKSNVVVFNDKEELLDEFVQTLISRKDRSDLFQQIKKSVEEDSYEIAENCLLDVMGVYSLDRIKPLVDCLDLMSWVVASSLKNEHVFENIDHVYLVEKQVVENEKDISTCMKQIKESVSSQIGISSDSKTIDNIHYIIRENVCYGVWAPLIKEESKINEIKEKITSTAGRENCNG